MKKFAIIIVNYNCINDTIETIGCLEKFDQKIFDIFLVDNYSEHDEQIKIKNFAKRKNLYFCQTAKNLGMAGGNNVAIKMALAKGYDYIFLLNPDMVINDLNFFEIIEEEMQREKADILGPLVNYYPEMDKIYFAGGYVNKITGRTIALDQRRKDVGKYKKNEKCDFIAGCAMVVRADVFRQAGLIPEDYFLYFEESDFCLKAKKMNMNIIFTPRTRCYHKVSVSIKYMSNTYLYYMVRNFKKFSLKYISAWTRPFFYAYYNLVWCPGLLFLSIKKGNYKGYRYIYSAMMNKEYA